MKIKNIIGKIIFALIGLWFIFIVAYAHSVDYLNLTDQESRPFYIKDKVFIMIGIVFFWGSAKFITISDIIIEFFKTKFKMTNNDTNIR